MQDTCSKEKCPYWKKFYSRKHGQQCPFFVETTWTQEKEHTPKIVMDCSPKRSLLMQMDLSNRLIGAQKAAEQARNESNRVSESLSTIVQSMQALPVMTDVLEIENAE